MTSRLSIYNDALLLCGERSITSLTVEEEGRRLLDQVWNNGGVRACLEEGQWMFAMRTIQIDYDPGIQPDYGYARGFDKPDDWVLTSAVCGDEFFRTPLLRYVDEAGFWFSDLDTIYVRYVSDDATYGGDLSLWPQSFVDFVAAHFASKIIIKLSNSEEKIRLFLNPERPEHGIRGRAMTRARSRCAMASPTMIPAQGQWSSSRRRGTNSSDRGNISGNLTG
jgi:hypothetical protein